MSSRPSALFVSYVCFAVMSLGLSADPLTKQQEIDFGRDVASRNLKGLATRSDGRLLPGPVFTDLTGPKIGDILWTLKPLGAERILLKSAQGVTDRVGSYRFLVGTGPEGKVQEVTLKPGETTYTVREVADVAETHAIALLPLPNGDLLIGTSPTAALYLYRNGKALARVPLPADSVFDFLPLPDGTVLAGTGNPGKIYRLDLAKLAKAGIIDGKVGSDTLLADHGVTLFGEIRDRNVRRIARLTDGAIIAGSSPKGNVYRFDATGGAPVFLQENRDAEVVDLLTQPDGSFYAAIVFTPGDTFRLAKSPDAKDDAKDILKEKDAPKSGFAGRSSVVRFPADGFPEPVIGKNGLSLYRLAQQGDSLLLTAGELGDALGYDPVARRTLTYAGSASAQLNDIAPLAQDSFLVLRNNAPGLAVLDFASAEPRSVETKRIDLGQPAELGALRFPRLRNIQLDQLTVEASTNQGSDELEGWTPWTGLKLRDDAFQLDTLRGRYVRYRISLPQTAADFQVDKPVQYFRPQNRRPVLADFRIFPPNQGLIPAPEQPGNVVSTLGQLLFPNQRELKGDAPDKAKGSFLGSQVVPQTGVQIIYWNVTDPDGDSLAYTFSIRADSAKEWTDLAVQITDGYVQFDTSSLAEGLYLTRLTVAEQAPRPAAQRISYTFETDNLLVDHTPPVITDTKIARADGNLVVTVSGRDALSLLEGVEFVLNNGVRDIVLHPVDGLLDGREESFRLELPEARASGATSVEVILYDQSGNTASRRLSLK